MKKTSLFLILAIFFLSINQCFADVIRTDWGVSVNQGNYTVEDPDGTADAVSKTTVSPNMALLLNDRMRMWMQLNFLDLNVPYSEGNVGQRVRSTSFDTLFQRAINQSNHLFYISAGGSISIDSFNNRYVSDGSGYITEKYDNRKGFNLALLVGAGYSKVFGDNSYGINLLYKQPIDNGIGEIQIGFYTLFLGDVVSR